jgi:hypothetical protein
MRRSEGGGKKFESGSRDAGRTRESHDVQPIILHGMRSSLGDVSCLAERVNSLESGHKSPAMLVYCNLRGQDGYMASPGCVELFSTGMGSSHVFSLETYI